jgi:hypothetical protein
VPDMFVSNSYKQQLLQQAFGQSSSSEDYVLDLFTNSVTVSDTTVAGSLTPGAWTGYAQVSIPRSSLQSASLTGNTAYMPTAVIPQFTNGSGSSVNVYGWMLRGASSGLLVVAQNFASPVADVAIPAGQVLTLYPFQVGLQSF